VDPYSKHTDHSDKSIIKDIDIIIAVLETGNSVELPATGNSMYPVLKPGDRVIVRPLKRGELPEPGKVVVYINNGVLVLHRLLKIIDTDPGQPQFITRGDSMSEYDKPFFQNQLTGLAISYYRSEKEYQVKTFIPQVWRYKINRRLLWIYNISRRIFP
jgi:signal peptidase I